MSDPDAAARSARRAAARRTHPDLGGDAEAFVQAMAAWPGSGGTPPPDPEQDTTSGTPITVRLGARSRARRLTSTPKFLVAGIRRRLPRSFPGSRRFGHL